MLVEWILNLQPSRPSVISKLYIWVNSPLFGVLYLCSISFPLFSLASYPIPPPRCLPSPTITIIIIIARPILPAPLPASAGR